MNCSSTSITYHLPVHDRALLQFLHSPPPCPLQGAPSLITSLTLMRCSSTFHLPPYCPLSGAPPSPSLTTSLSLMRHSSTSFTYRRPVLYKALLHLLAELRQPELNLRLRIERLPSREVLAAADGLGQLSVGDGFVLYPPTHPVQPRPETIQEQSCPVFICRRWI